MCSSLLNIETVNITIPKELISYLILVKLLNQDLDQVVDCIDLSPESTKDPCIVLKSLQTFYTHKMNKELGKAISMVTTNKSPFKGGIIILQSDFCRDYALQDGSYAKF